MCISKCGKRKKKENVAKGKKREIDRKIAREKVCSNNSDMDCLSCIRSVECGVESMLLNKSSFSKGQEKDLVY